jgi:DNA (cytosine-5)-methyltransferase 1
VAARPAIITLTAVCLFSGAGGFCEGVRLAGWQVVCAVESDAQACLTPAANFAEVALFKGDIARFLQDAQAGVPGLDELVTRKIDVVYGGPPCQGLAIGPRNLDDPRNRLHEEFIRVVRLLKPRAFVMGNVPSLVGDA